MFALSDHTGSSIIEVMTVLVILTVGIVGAYTILFQSDTFARTTEDRIQAINIARDGIEAVKNIRDTNWVKFSSDTKNCFDTMDYTGACIGNATPTGKIASGSYILENTGWIFFLRPTSSSGVYIDAQGLISQSGTTTVLCNQNKRIDCKTRFTRIIKIERPWNDIKIHSIVTWSNTSRGKPYVIDLEHTLTNWKYDQTQ